MESKYKKIVNTLFSITKSSAEARALLEFVLENINIQEKFDEIKASYVRYCVACDAAYFSERSNAPTEGFCENCNTDLNRQELMRVQKQRRRAIRAEKAATLTFRQWMDTLEHFEFKCAYCQKMAFHDMEHYIPLRLCDQRRGTTCNNVVPACSACNFYKKSKNPLSAKSRRYIRIPEQNLKRVERFLGGL